MTAVRQATLDEPALEVRRLSRPGDQVAHLFSAGAGWTRSLCRAVTWTAALREPTDVATDCADCRDVASRIGAVLRPALTESEARLLDGNR